MEYNVGDRMIMYGKNGTELVWEFSNTLDWELVEINEKSVDHSQRSNVVEI